jgi:outer membrane lipoprotein SlyB
MRSLRAIAFLLLVAALPACATTMTSESTWEAPPEPEWVRYGTVTQVREVVQRTEGNPGGGAVAGAVIGGLLTGRLFGAAAGAGIGAAASSGSEERRSYQVWVRFQDGGTQAFWYANFSPFRPGDSVALTPRGLYKS